MCVFIALHRATASHFTWSKPPAGASGGLDPAQVAENIFGRAGSCRGTGPLYSSASMPVRIRAYRSMGVLKLGQAKDFKFLMIDIETCTTATLTAGEL